MKYYCTNSQKWSPSAAIEKNTNQKLLCLIKKAGSSHNIQVACAGVQEIYAVKFFQIPRVTKRWSLSLVSWRLFQLFWRWTRPLTFTLNLAKSLEQLFLYGALLFKYFAGDYYLLMWLVLLSCEINLTLERVVSSEMFSEAWDQNTLHWLSEKWYFPLYA